MEEKLRVGVSSCLLGQPVRYDGQHKLDRYVRDTLGRFFAFVPVCPEVEAGFGVPRESMRLVGDPAAPRLVTTRTGIDLTGRMDAWRRRRVEELAGERLCGFILKSGSPSSGMERVKVYAEAGGPPRKGVGLFAAALMERLPLLPVEEEGRLHDPGLRENFIERVFVTGRWQALLDGGVTRGRLVEFHTRHKLLVRAHSPNRYRELGRLVAGLAGRPLAAVATEYHARLIDGLRHQATPGRQVDVLLHCLGHFKRQLAADEKAEAIELVERYRAGQLPLIVPVTLINHFVRKYREPYLADQHWLNPAPAELALRNHV